MGVLFLFSLISCAVSYCLCVYVCADAGSECSGESAGIDKGEGAHDEEHSS